MAHRDYEEFLASLNAHGVRYLIGGAHALALHARPRATKDLDLFIEATARNAERLVAAVREFFGGKAPSYVSVKHLLDPAVIVQLGVAPVRIDLLTTPGAPGGFRGAWRRKVDAPFGTVDAHYLSMDDLIADKRFWDRDQDRVDVQVLLRARAKPQRRKKRPVATAARKGR
jgi:hypothetical protein